MTAPRWVLLHGAPLSPAAWDGVRDSLAAVAPDLSNWGLGGAGSETGILQRDLAESVLADLPDERLVVVGHSIGGQVAMEMALLAPDRVQCVVLVCTRDIPVPEFASTATALRNGTVLDVDAVLRRWFTADELAEDGEVVNYARRQLRETPPPRYAAALDALATYDRRQHVAQMTVPAVLLCGGADLGCTPSVMTMLANDLPHATLHVVGEWAHMSPFLDPAALVVLLRAAVDSG